MKFYNFDLWRLSTSEYVMKKLDTSILERITLKPGLMGGRPTIRGLRFTVGDVLELLASGLSPEEILDEHPILEYEDIRAALLYASMKFKNTTTIHAA